MGNLRFIVKRLKTANVGGFAVTAKEVSKINHKPWPVVLFDILNCTRKYGSGRVDYITFKMYDMTPEERDKVLTIGKNNTIVTTYNNMAYAKYFDDKALFNEKFNKFLKRDWMVINENNYEEFEKFAQAHTPLIIKPLDLSCGTGIEKIDVPEVDDLKALHTRLVAEHKFLIEECVIQDDTMSKLCSTSINTIRIITILHEGKAKVFAGAVRMGREGNFVDNFDFGGYEANIGGLAATLDVEKGELMTDAIDKHRNVYETVPVLGTRVNGFKIPDWDKVIELVNEAATVVPEMRYVGWDVGMSRDHGPLLIEGNNLPAQDFIQIPELGLGTYEKFCSLINEK